MRVGMGLALTNTFQRPFAVSLRHLAQQVEQAGFATLAVGDHFALRSPRQPDMTDWYESWSTLAFVAACTQRVRLSTLVTGITLRNPVALVKTVNTVDALSGGRVCLSVGASPNFGADEHGRMGLPFPSAGERIARLEEALQIARQLWSGDDTPFAGAYYQLTSTAGTPLCIQQPHPPILIAGDGPKMLRLMAQYADVVSIGGFGQNLDALRAKLEVLRRHCQTLNRPYAQIEKTTLFLAPVVQNGRLDATALATFRALAELGFDEVMIPPPGDPAAWDLLAAELIPAVAEIPVNRQ